ncbi:hypothetical protein KEU06_28925 [Pseudaminobacter sp. 19-2017]|uniref:Uncharacterized protein n=1 Tax=Pseudaminobacter soli (ex Zhang et al. 2022) TaxID=2831468 RepID=A0A942E2H5_9HYPH|nr:hypothetical protein [Pseudaminobacter soli]MBS3652604.1 hypothetical protein [Pseudaminobacter soli]
MASDYLATKMPGVFEVQQRRGARDKGRDIVVWLDPPGAAPRRWQLYQCKHYGAVLGAGTAAEEIGRVLYYTSIDDYIAPEEYWFVTHKGVTSPFQDLLDDPKKLKGFVLDHWNQYCAEKNHKDEEDRTGRRVQSARRCVRLQHPPREAATRPHRRTR